MLANTEQILYKLPDILRIKISELPSDVLDNLEEIRLSCNHKAMIVSGSKISILENSEAISPVILDEIFNKLLNYSYYAYEEELSKGFVTIEGGHRVGICGKVILKDGEVSLIKDISSLNIRRSREIIGASDKVIKYIINDGDDGGFCVKNTLIVSPPKCGKTTILRDVARNLSKRGIRVGICDERSELAGCYNCCPSYDLGDYCDILDGCPKSEGIKMLIRAMSPQVIITDEIGKKEDVVSIEEASCAGVNTITSVHGSNINDVLCSPIGSLIEKKVFSNLIFLSSIPATGTVIKVIQFKDKE